MLEAYGHIHNLKGACIIISAKRLCTPRAGGPEWGASRARAPAWGLQAATVLPANSHFTDEKTSSQTHTPLTEPTEEQAP